MNATTNLDAARYCHEFLGWSFTLLNGKRPIRKGWQQEARLPWETIEAHQGNIGLRTGLSSRVVVVDIDEEGDYNLPETVEVRTGKGRHLYYTYYGPPLSGRIGHIYPGVDVRADGNQVVFPGSVHPETGQVYEFIVAPWDREPALLPNWIIEACSPPEAESTPQAEATGEKDKGEYVPRGSFPTHYLKMAFRLEMNALRGAVEGERNDQLNRSAFAMGQFVGAGALDRAMVEQELLSAAIHIGLPRGEGMATIRSGLDAGEKEPRRPPEPSSAPPAAPGEKSAYVLVPGGHTDDMGKAIKQSTATFVADVMDHMPEDLLYTRSHIPGHLLGDPGKRRWYEIEPDAMRLVIDSHMELGAWATNRETQEQFLAFRPCSRDWGGLVIAGAYDCPKTRPLERIVSYPVYGPDWERIMPGYANGVYYDEPPELRGLEPIRDDQEIQYQLDSLLTDFPFETRADFENFVGLLLTPIVAPAIQGNRPLHLITASIERTGKSKLVEEVLGGILLGGSTPSMSITSNDDERDKRIISKLLGGATLLFLDNLPAKLDSASLASLLTSGTYEARQLQQTRILSLKNNLTVVATGNNTICSGEIAKRVVPIVLQPKTAHPERRTQFEHPDLGAWIRQQRREIIGILLGMVENWKLKGQPDSPDPRPIGGFESWARTIGAILHCNFFQHWRLNEFAWQNKSDDDGEQREDFIGAWWAEYKSAEVTVGELLKTAERYDLFGWMLDKPTPRGRETALGNWLRKHRDTPIRDKVVRYRKHGHATMYRLE